MLVSWRGVKRFSMWGYEYLIAVLAVNVVLALGCGHVYASVSGCHDRCFACCAFPPDQKRGGSLKISLRTLNSVCAATLIGTRRLVSPMSTCRTTFPVESTALSGVHSTLPYLTIRELIARPSLSQRRAKIYLSSPFCLPRFVQCGEQLLSPYIHLKSLI